MANPNILTTTSCYGGFDYFNVTSSTEFTAINNPASSGKIIVIQNMWICMATDVASDTLLTYYPQDDRGGTGVLLYGWDFPLHGTTPVAYLIESNQPFYLEEDRSFGFSATGQVYLFVAYEVIS